MAHWKNTDKFLFADKEFEYYVHFTPKNADFYFVRKETRIGDSISTSELISIYKRTFYEMNKALAEAFSEANQKTNFIPVAETIMIEGVE